ncbi:MAG: hypothetical protein IT489_00775 [Gammaproteobacteria bacterium]|nr:hypothetical protein [Gammaproteobacteria bacterium]
MIKIRDPQTHDIEIYTALTLFLAAFVIGAHFFGGVLGVYEWRLSLLLENLQHMNPWVETGITVALVVAIVGLLVHERDMLKPCEATSIDKWDTEHGL